MGKRTSQIIAIILGNFCAANIGYAAENCDMSTVHVIGAFGEVRFNVEIAATPQERATGLMYRKSMPRMSGMLFEFEAPQTTSFWMKNTEIPLDMIFANEDGTIVTLHSNAIPHDTTPIWGGDTIKFVLEINGGLANLLGISENDQLLNPARRDPLTWLCPTS